MRPRDPDLAVVCIRLRKQDIERAKTIAARTGIGYQHWIRERVSEAARNGTGARIWKLKGRGALAIVRADTADGARSAARGYGVAYAAELGVPPAPFTSWIEAAEARELPETPGVVAWAGIGPPIAPGRPRADRY